MMFLSGFSNTIYFSVLSELCWAKNVHFTKHDVVFFTMMSVFLVGEKFFFF